ncbi:MULTISPECIES: hypothetical protein [Streptomyces]|uniref:Uncharacterized protein n=1 Tax=Streptomyces clavifer TaxID=68188 RepID=A0ABS4VEH0_9ACTN|nr:MULTISPECIES: hypothetical protein [Streptomyces]KQX89953.1 hypothetical protein ASD26_02150 [Streptomyces sp. Root1319]KQZ20346.1 hypothetical protein ASD51_22655 [Streptomyces sp. Root55]MBP2362201.1 hypothetical protein [Streptomyces clavifer]MDX2747406.1 hypothetical protein [Streptomyces sp. NRRL_B-2557]MDX3063727.1 hypothetical protein [Streptomyces sp. ND04-05B]
MRPSQDPSGGRSPTPIYDALYSEYRRLFRALPGDRSGEENLGFRTFGIGMLSSRAPLGGRTAANSRGSQTGRSGNLGSWQRVGRHAGGARPAALPPGSTDA